MLITYVVICSIAVGFQRYFPICLIGIFFVAAVQGSIHSVTHEEPLLQTRISVKVARVHHQSESLFTTKRALQDNADIHVPIDCGVKKGKGQFMFVGKVQLGLPRLQCAPRLKEWQTIRQQAIQEGWNECSLD